MTPFPSVPGIGQEWGNWAWNGARWVASPTAGLRQNVVSFTQSGPYMPSPGLVSLTVECIGGGGGGGYASLATTATEAAMGAGGGSGGYSRKTLPAALVRGGVLVTVGAGGTAGYSPTQATAGQATSFGALCIANGGDGGRAADNNTGLESEGFPGAGAMAGTGDVVFPGTGGDAGGWRSISGTTVSISVANPRGGWIYSGTTVGLCAPNAALEGQAGSPNTGSGGSGGVMNQEGGMAPGGAGGSGLCVVTETIVGDRDQPVSEVPETTITANLVLGPPQPPWPPGPPRPPWGPQPREWEPWEDPNAFGDP